MNTNATVHIDLKNLRAIALGAESDFKNVSNGPIRKAYRQWAVRMRSFLQERFDTYSKGGGDWPALAQSTIDGRRSGTGKVGKRSSLARVATRDKNGNITGYVLRQATKARGKTKKRGAVSVSILRDKGLLFQALAPIFEARPGQYEEHTEYGVKVGYGGPAGHGDGGPTIADIASFHQEGGNYLPQRKIIVPPDYALYQDMKQDMVNAVVAILNGEH